ncbi:ImmA/IrrE family metallo-endopeptidase [Rothia sp. ZJ932]|uniref:helix-turn-helix domain-containing protein n=1 Tax=Rothia sp. ZJ932 TaxID=2810516 RepID=UPI00196865E5|nr:XRE family transcriptional regulator [Rothia sp. ZJ932]QRZ61723.1 ImmA/IrrE family metallo-endopeptidase [Rothia sp. ZJ932]
MSPSVHPVEHPDTIPQPLSLIPREKELVAVPETVKLLRLRRGFTLEAASAQIGKQKGWASKIERGNLELKGEDLESYAEILDVHVKLLTIELPMVDAEGMMFRKYRTPKKTVNMLEAEASLRLHVVNRLLEISNQPSAPLFEQIAANNNHQVVEAARQTRARWGIPPDAPVGNLTGYLERDGIFLTFLPLDVEKVNGVTYWHDEQTPPLMMLTRKTIDNTKRFTMAHEFAHLVLDKYSSRLDSPKAVEARADLFAGELLAPYEVVRGQFFSLNTGDVDGLINLARYWGLHPKSFVTRASIHGDISKDQASSWYKNLGGITKSRIENEFPAYPVRFNALGKITDYLNKYHWNMASVLSEVLVRRSDFEQLVGVDNSLSYGAGRPNFRVV